MVKLGFDLVLLSLGSQAFPMAMRPLANAENASEAPPDFLPRTSPSIAAENAIKYGKLTTLMITR